jgi:hypothetical protein
MVERKHSNTNNNKRNMATIVAIIITETKLKTAVDFRTLGNVYMLKCELRM